MKIIHMECTRNCKGIYIYIYVTNSLDKEKRYYWITFLLKYQELKESAFNLPSPCSDLILNIFLFPTSPRSLRHTLRCILASSMCNACTRTGWTEASIPILWANSWCGSYLRGTTKLCPFLQVYHTPPCTLQYYSHMQWTVKQAAN